MPKIKESISNGLTFFTLQKKEFVGPYNFPVLFFSRAGLSLRATSIPRAKFVFFCAVVWCRRAVGLGPYRCSLPIGYESLEGSDGFQATGDRIKPTI
jgi:hypothetical protein